MKLSIAWIFDHIDADWQKFDIADIVSRFNRTTAEIERVEKVTFDKDRFALAQVVSVGQNVQLQCAEWDVECTVPLRDDVCVGAYFVITKKGDAYAWATVADWHCPKDGLLPRMWVSQSEFAGTWKKHIDTIDYILDVDNKSITHRPDMWGHRGFAREIAAMLDVPFKSLKNFVSDLSLKQYEWSASATKNQPIAITIKDQDGCNRFAACYMQGVSYCPSLPWMAYRLARTESRSIDAIVDATNYVMLDIGHPMHAFDADNISGQEIIVRKARKTEVLTLLDGQQLQLRPEDIVVADGDGAISLAGIMGGKDSGVCNNTKNLLLEAAWFDATTIRRTATHFKLRTESSARFEKTMDPNGNSVALQRFVRVLEDANINFKMCSVIASVGSQADPMVIAITHEFIEKQIGVVVDPQAVEDICAKLSFGVERKMMNDGIMYSVTVPTFRSTKDVQIKQDIVEEIARFIGYDNITPELPRLALEPAQLQRINRVRTIRRLCAYAMDMQELYGYSFHDESFLRKIRWQPANAISVASPVSENWSQLVTTLVPNMLKAVQDNSAEHDKLRFFEWARVWQKEPLVVEQKKLVGIFFDKKNQIDFYEAKQSVSHLFDALRCTVSWQQVADPEHPWFAPYRTAHIMHNDVCVGIAGIAEPFFLKDITDGHAFIFELDGDFLLSYQAEQKRFTQLAKYPDVSRDVSLMVPLKTTVQMLEEIIVGADEHVQHVALQDFFTKPEWKNQKALTFRFVLRDQNKTMTKEQADSICDTITDALARAGADIR